MSFKEKSIAALKAMTLPKTSGKGLEFDLVDQHNQTIRDAI